MTEDDDFHLQNRVLQFISGHGNPTAEDIAKEFGRDVDWARGTIRNLRRWGWLVTKPLTFRVSERGARKMIQPMKCTPAKRARAQAARDKIAAKSNSIVAQAVANQTALASAWGSM